MFNQTQKIFLTLGVGAVSLLGANQVSAQQAYASGSSTITLMNGAAQSIGAEIAAPGGAQFQVGAATTVQIDTTGLAAAGLSANTALLSTLAVDAGTVTAAPPGGSFTAAAAAKLTPGLALSDAVSLIRAGAGIDGLD